MASGIVTQSITRIGRYEPFNLQVGRNQISYHSSVNVQGFNSAMPITYRAVWELADTTDYVFPSAAVSMSFTSGSAETCTVVVSGLDANYALKSATVTFSASTTGTVTSGTSTFFRINGMRVTSGTTVGNITAANGGVTYAQINAGTGQSQASIFTVPAGYTFYLARAQAYSTNNGSHFTTYRVYSQTISNGVTTPNIVLTAPFQTNYTSLRVVPRPYLEKTDVQWQLKGDIIAPGSIQLEGYLIQNDPAA